jgi:threonine dehydrogenase-like Zn-dependent dehydrogenase
VDGIGVDRVIDAVGVDAQQPATGVDAQQAEQFDAEQAQAAPQTGVDGANWVPGDAPSQASRWAADAVAKAGTIGIIGVYPQTFDSYPIGVVMNKNVTVKAGNCNHRHYIPQLVELVTNGTVDPALLLTGNEPMTDVLAAYREFDRREPGWIKVALNPTT